MYLDHIKEILTGMKEENLEMDLPFAIFMKKLLSIKIQFTMDDGLLKYSNIFKLCKCSIPAKEASWLLLQSNTSKLDKFSIPFKEAS